MKRANIAWHFFLSEKYFHMNGFSIWSLLFGQKEEAKKYEEKWQHEQNIGTIIHELNPFSIYVYVVCTCTFYLSKNVHRIFLFICWNFFFVEFAQRKNHQQQQGVVKYYKFPCRILCVAFLSHFFIFFSSLLVDSSSLTDLQAVA